MRRFYCVICEKVKRVQKWPKQVENRESVRVYDRVGYCNKHGQTIQRKVAR